MKEKDLLKKVIQDQIPNQRAVRCAAISQDKTTKKTVGFKRYVLLGATAAVVLMASAYIHLASRSSILPPNIVPPANTIYINSIEGVDVDREKAYFDPALTYEKELSQEDLLAYFGLDIRPTKLPKGLVEIVPDKYTMIYSNDDTVLYDRLTFRYSAQTAKDVYDPLARAVSVIVSKVMQADSCGLYVSENEKVPSLINGVQVMLGYRQMGYGPYEVVEGPNTPAGYYDLYVASFAQNGIYYEIVADNITETELVDMLASMIITK